MSVQRLAKYSSADPFTMVPNSTINDARLGPKALGLLVFMLSKPDGWSFREQTLATQMGVSRAQIRTAMGPLLKLGYVERVWDSENGLPVRITRVFDIQPEVRNQDNREHERSESVPVSKTEGSKNLARSSRDDFYVRRLVVDLEQNHHTAVDLTADSLGENYLAVARTASQVFDENTHRGQIIGLTVELLERAFGSMPKQARGMVARLVGTHRPMAVLEAAVRTTGASVGLDPKYAEDPLGPVRYLAGVLRGGR